MNQYHYLQLEILKKLLFSEGLTYTELKLDENIENGKHTFHLNQLVKDGFVEKVDDKYRLTNIGKEYANRMDTDTTQVKKQGKIGALQCAARNINGEWEFLIGTRLKQPNYGKQGFGSGKVWWGEKAQFAAKRELKEETNLEAEPELFFISHRIVYTKETNELVEDKYMYFYRCINPTGELKANNEGKFEWVKQSKLREYFTKPFDTVDYLIDITNKCIDLDLPLAFEEYEEVVEGF